MNGFQARALGHIPARHISRMVSDYEVTTEEMGINDGEDGKLAT